MIERPAPEKLGGSRSRDAPSSNYSSTYTSYQQMPPSRPSSTNTSSKPSKPLPNPGPGPSSVPPEASASRYSQWQGDRTGGSRTQGAPLTQSGYSSRPGPPASRSSYGSAYQSSVRHDDFVPKLQSRATAPSGISTNLNPRPGPPLSAASSTTSASGVSDKPKKKGLFSKFKS